MKKETEVWKSSGI